MSQEIDEQKAFDSMIDLYIDYETGQLPEEIIESLDETGNWKEHSQAMIAKSLIASIIGKKIKKNPEINMDDALALVKKTITKNFKFGFCEAFKDN